MSDRTRPSLRQRFFANNGIQWLAALLVASVVAWRFIPLIWLSSGSRGEAVVVAEATVLILAGGVLGWFLAVFPGAIVLGPFIRMVTRINGAPFHVGDHVMILAGKRAGRIVQIYDVWPTRGQVRVELGKVSRAAFSDVYFETQICRANSNVGDSNA